jgi:hypothetical protein
MASLLGATLGGLCAFNLGNQGGIGFKRCFFAMALPIVTGISDQLEPNSSQVLQITSHDAIFEVEIRAAELPLFLGTMQKSLICRVALSEGTVVLPTLEVSDINLAHRRTATELLLSTAEIGSLVLRLSDETLSVLKYKIAGAMLRRSWARFGQPLTSPTSWRKR